MFNGKNWRQTEERDGNPNPNRSFELLPLKTREETSCPTLNGLSWETAENSGNHNGVQDERAPSGRSLPLSNHDEAAIKGDVYPWKGLRHFINSGGVVNPMGMNWFITALFIVGETAGGGLVALASAVEKIGPWLGMLVIFTVALFSMYTGDMLGDCWTILQLRWPEYRSHTRNPYPQIGLHAVGPKMKTIVSIVLNLTQFGTAAVFLLLAARNLESLILVWFDHHISFCVLVLVTAGAVFPLTLLKSPKDFWIAVLAAMMTTTIAVVLILTGIGLDSPHCLPISQNSYFQKSHLFMAFGTMMFAFGGHAAFPTIHHDMRKPSHFRRSVGLAFLITTLFYTPVALYGAHVYGTSLHDTIIVSIQNLTIQQLVNLCITLHVTLALTIVFNPMYQEVENLLRLKEDFGVKHVLARGAVMLSVVFVAESFPTFGPLLDLVGGSTITLMALIFPAIFYLFLHAKLEKYGAMPLHNQETIGLADVIRYNAKARIVFCFTITVCALVAGISSSHYAVQALLTTQFSPPCYAGLLPGVNTEISSLNNSTLGKFFCCGPHSNVSALGPNMCLDPNIFKSSGSHG